MQTGLYFMLALAFGGCLSAEEAAKIQAGLNAGAEVCRETLRTLLTDSNTITTEQILKLAQVSITKPLSVFKEDIVNAISGNCGAKHTIYMSDAQCTDPEHSGCRTVFGTPAGPSCALLLSACRCQCGTVATTPTTTETTTPSIPATSPEPTTAVTTSALKKCRPHIAAYLGSIHGTMYAFRRFLIFVRATYHSQYPNAEQFFKKQITHLEEVESELENALALNGITMSSMTLQTDINEMNLENFEIRVIYFETIRLLQILSYYEKHLLSCTQNNLRRLHFTVKQLVLNIKKNLLAKEQKFYINHVFVIDQGFKKLLDEIRITISVRNEPSHNLFM